MRTAEDVIYDVDEFINYVNDPDDDEKRLLNILRKFEGSVRKAERQKSADLVRSMKIEDITDAGTIADAILKT